MRNTSGTYHTALLILFLLTGAAGSAAAAPPSPLTVEQHVAADANDGLIPEIDVSHLHADLPIQQSPTRTGAVPAAPVTVTSSDSAPRIVISASSPPQWLVQSRAPRANVINMMPEPGAMPLFLTGLLAFTAPLAARRRARRALQLAETNLPPSSSRDSVE